MLRYLNKNCKQYGENFQKPLNNLETEHLHIAFDYDLCNFFR